MDCTSLGETELTELDVGSASDELESGESRVCRPVPRPFTIESLIGTKSDHHLERNAGDKRRLQPATGASCNGDSIEELENREREIAYQQHCLATATNALPGITYL